MTQVCKDVGWDGQGFYCMRCGKAGFKSEASARGHLSQCKGRAIARGVPAVGMLPRSSDSGCCEEVVLRPPVGGDGGGTYPLFSGGGGAPGGQNTTHALGDSGGMLTQEIAAESSGWYSGIDTRLRLLENEYNHLLMERNQPQHYPIKQDFFSQYKGVIIVGAIVLFAVILSNQSNQCQVGSGTKGANMGDIGTKALSKLVDVGISKGVTSLFK